MATEEILTPYPAGADACAKNFGSVSYSYTETTAYVGRSDGIQPENVAYLPFRLTIPRGSVITRAKLVLKCSSDAVLLGASRQVALGMLRDDGKWPGAGFTTAAGYATANDFPNPTAAFSNAIIPGVLVGESWLGVFSYTAAQMASGETVSIGDGAYAPTFTIDLASSIQDFVAASSYDPDDPEASSIALVLDPQNTTAGQDRFYFYTDDHSTQPGPKLYVEWEPASVAPGPRTPDEIRVELKRNWPEWAQHMTGIDDLVARGTAAVFAYLEDRVQALHEQTYILLSTGGWLNQHGRERGIYRASGETDDKYRPRITEVIDAVTPNAMAQRLSLVLETGVAKITEWRGDGPFAMRDGSTSLKGWFARPTMVTRQTKGFWVQIPPQGVIYDQSFYAVRDGTAALAKVSNFAVRDSAGNVGAFAGAGGIPQSAIYTRVFREVNRTRAFGVGFTIYVEE